MWRIRHTKVLHTFRLRHLPEKLGKKKFAPQIEEKRKNRKKKTSMKRKENQIEIKIQTDKWQMKIERRKK